MSEQDKRPDDDGRPPLERPESLEVPDPSLHVSADEVELAEPTLGQARISEDAAAEADLAKAAAEAEEVEKEADAAGQLVGGTREDRAIKARGTAPAGAPAGDQGPAGDAPAGDRAAAETSVPDATSKPARGAAAAKGAPAPDAPQPAQGATAPGAPAPEAPQTAQGATAVPGTPATSKPDAAPNPASGATAATGAPASPAAAVPPSAWEPAPPGTDGSAPEKKWYSTAADGLRRSGAGDDASGDPAAGPARKMDWKPLVIIGAVVIVAIVIIAMIVSSLTSGSPAGGAASPASSQTAAETPNGDGVIAENVSPFDFQQGQCFTDFEAVMREATVVTCDTPHTAQLVGTFSYGDDEEFPGADELNIKAQEVCTAVALNDSAADQPDLKDSYGMPSNETWAQGDRRIDCFKIAEDGQEITGSLVDQ